jgi:hypothetical protein
MSVLCAESSRQVLLTRFPLWAFSFCFLFKEKNHLYLYKLHADHSNTNKGSALIDYCRGGTVCTHETTKTPN